MRDYLTAANKTEGNSTVYYEATYVVTDENIRSWADNLSLVGNNKKNTLFGNTGNNKIWGKEGSDVIYGKEGNDTIYGGADNDTLYGGSGENYLYGEGGNNSYVFNSHEAAQDIITLGSGNDLLRFENYNYDELIYGNNNGNLVITYNNGNSSATVKDYFSKSLYNKISKLDDKTTIARTLTTDGAWGENAYDFYRDILTQTELTYDKYIDNTKANNVIGTKLRDSISASDYDDTINAGAGNDSINGGAGNDIIKAGEDNDTIYGSHGNDKIYGEAGRNTIIYDTDFSGNDTIFSGKGEDYIELTSKTRNDLIYVKDGQNLVITCDSDEGTSITVQNYFKSKGNTSVKGIKLTRDNSTTDNLDLVKEYDNISAAAVNSIKYFNGAWNA